ncbi:haloacid dehalogenase [Rodentibacter mrazii]|uniref:phosphoglycolate phosphatase n=1 Tax=Rodentibacter mrazii TaxID=1908257 RepID=A0A1V3IGK1_9PAST|nr:HAD hydrolase-like protein [Rodentibacter mrazii]OOF39629.1 haloacid dehalogenase [Rodentibacter mrazii]
MKNFNKQKEVIICIDSDGCVMDTMNIKHEKCFGPDAVQIFQIEERERFLSLWNEINLFSETRGCNRFKGLVLTLERYGYQGDINQLKTWVNNTKELSNRALKQVLEQSSSADLILALQWSEQVNQNISAIKEKFKAFPNIKENLAFIKRFADVAVVSAANNEAIIDEWGKNNLLENVDIVFGQDQGSKAHSLNTLKSYGYLPENILMVGDSPGDLNSAIEAGVRFFPILCNAENESWQLLVLEALGKLIYGKFSNSDQQCLIEQFQHNLSKVK